MQPARVAFFPDSFHEVNGVAHTSRNFVSYALRHHLPLLCVRAGTREQAVADEGSVRTLELSRSAASVGMEKDLAFDPVFWRHADVIEDELRRFKPDLLHMTGPSELGIFAAYFAWKLNLPLAASWHTNVHEYAARRLAWLTKLIPGALGESTNDAIEGGALDVTLRFYARAQILFAPNRELCELLERRTGRPCRLMQRGVDTRHFTPAHRTRRERSPFRLGFVGRLSIEKNVALLPQLQRQMTAAGIEVEFVIIGHGAEEVALRRELPTATFTGVLRGLALAEAYADMDLLVFPSHTDTFGNVVLEAMASGVPAIVTPDGGPHFIVEQASSSCGPAGLVVPDEEFSRTIARVIADPQRLATMRESARSYALTCSWDAVFDRIYSAYLPLLRDRERDLTAGAAAASSPG